MTTLRSRIARLEKRNTRLLGILRNLLALLRRLKLDLSRVRVSALDKTRVLRADTTCRLDRFNGAALHEARKGIMF